MTAEIEQEFYILDYHKDMVNEAEVIINELKSKGCHTVIYLTDLEGNLMLNRVDEDEFLSHFSVNTID